ncbi:MAG: hypothetical protein JOZ63_12370 [Planctomycetaceae bacterium]|nr:hypothetical protein [Planctomycetaceae bacterium]MBV8383396.1 hypothetical protein [Planctomycetaceae bacterium]
MAGDLTKALRQCCPRMAIDLTLNTLHGLPLRVPEEIVRGKPKSGTEHPLQRPTSSRSATAPPSP